MWGENPVVVSSTYKIKGGRHERDSLFCRARACGPGALVRYAGERRHQRRPDGECPGAPPSPLAAEEALLRQADACALECGLQNVRKLLTRSPLSQHEHLESQGWARCNLAHPIMSKISRWWRIEKTHPAGIAGAPKI
jgi:hypothetical protein